ncbi:MAG: prepilin peptidase [bacterium]
MLIKIFLFILGICVGSFLNVIIGWLEQKRKNIFGRSFCDTCKKKLKFYDLIPVLSFLLLRGRCRYCQTKIKLEYLFVELATGILFVLSGFNILLVFIAALIIIFVYDLKHYLIPEIIILPAIILAGIFFWQNWLAMLIASGFFAFLVLISHETWMGWGDVKLAVLMGLLLGWPNILLALFASFLFGAIIGVMLIVFNKKTMKSQIPFGPFLVGATIICLYLNHLHLLSFLWLWPLLA